MANVYESDSFNIVSVYEKTAIEDDGDGISYTTTNLLLKVQRLPLDQYPQLTDVFIFNSELSLDISKEEFLSKAPSIVASKLSEFDSTFTDTAVNLTLITDLTQKFTN
jgi:hypothetical protein